MSPPDGKIANTRQNLRKYRNNLKKKHIIVEAVAAGPCAQTAAGAPTL